MKNIWKIWTLSLLVKLFISAILPLSADEAYYWVWGQKPQLSYFDHPPAVSWLFYMGSFLEPFLHSVRWPAVVLGHGVLGLWILIFKDRLQLEKIQLWMWLVLLSPLLGFGSLIITPDIPVLFFWSAAIYFSLRALESKNLIDYAAFGAALGLGFCSKYHIVLFIPCLITYLTIEKKWTAARWSGVLLTALMGLVFCTPVILWNIQNNFASFEFQLKHGLEKSQYTFEWTSSYVLGQILLLFPLVFWAALRAKVPRALKWLPYFGWGPLLFFFLTSFRASTEANWPIIGYPALLGCALFHPKIFDWKKYYLWFWGALIAVVLSSMFIPQLRNLHEKINEPYLYQEMAPLVHAYKPLYADSYQMAASIWYFSKTPTYKLKEMSRIDFFDTFPEAIPQGDKFYLIQKEGNGLPQWFFAEKWAKTEIKKISDNYILWEFRRP